MDNLNSFCSKYFLALTVLILFFLAVVSSYFRFVVQSDYLVCFEGWCDTESESCFVNSYEDEDCSSPNPNDCLVEYTYKLVEKPAKNYRKQLKECDPGNPFLDPMECEIVDGCSENEDRCTVRYCDPDIDSNCFTTNNKLEKE